MGCSDKGAYIFSKSSPGEGAGSGIDAGLRGEGGTGEPSRFLWNGLRVWKRETGEAISSRVSKIAEDLNHVGGYIPSSADENHWRVSESGEKSLESNELSM